MTLDPLARIRAVGQWRTLYRLRDYLADDGRRRRALLRTGVGVQVVVAALAYFTRRRGHLPFDLQMTTRLQEIEDIAARELLTRVSAFGYHPWNVATVGTGCTVVGFALGWRECAYLSTVTLLSGLTTTFLKRAIGRARPDETLVDVAFPAGDDSFPSGHVILYTVYFGFLFFLVWSHMRRSPLRALLLLLTGSLIILVGPSRIFLGAHWLSDVVAGHLVGLIILLTAIEIYLDRFPRRLTQYG